MATSVSSPAEASAAKIPAGVPALRAGQGNSFLWRRLHSLSGIFPIGAFLVEHFFSNAFATNGGAAYNENVRFLTGLPFVLWLEIMLHLHPAGLPRRCTDSGSGGAASPTSATIPGWATGCTRCSATPGSWPSSTSATTPGRCASAARTSLPTPRSPTPRCGPNCRIPGWWRFTCVGLAAASWHFAYGIWLFAAKWGFIVGEQGRKKFGYVCLVIGLALAGMARGLGVCLHHHAGRARCRTCRSSGNCSIPRRPMSYRLFNS